MWALGPAKTSLASKCLLLFGAAVVLIVALALSLPWLRMNALVASGELELSRRLASTWEALERAAEEGGAGQRADGDPVEHAGIVARRVGLEQARELARADRFVARALARFEADPERGDLQAGHLEGAGIAYRYAKVVRDAAGEPVQLVLMDRRSSRAARLLLINTAYLLVSGSVVLALALGVFYLMTHRLVLAPVRELKRTAERVRAGDLTTRARIATGDEFEDLAETFNAMLGELVRNAEQLRAINVAMDLKLSELAESNTALYEAARLKGEFLANVSHELRTPMNSIIGFAELLLETARSEQQAGDDSTRLAKRVHYLENIVSAARQLLEMITSLLEMARIEAGRVEVRVGTMSLRETCEALAGLIHPLAQRRGLEVQLELAEDLPTIETDAQKVRQILSNLLSNAVKFADPVDSAGRPGRVILRAERLPGTTDADARVRLSVIDTGPGIAPEDQRRIFDKFQQLDSGHTREHTGAGLGLAICRELATMLQGEIQLVSAPGQGSMFSLILPLKLDPQRLAETKLESRFRGALQDRRSWFAPAGAQESAGPA